jgi:ribosome-interacting GTPase 1
MIGIFGKVKPAGPHANVLKEDLDNKKANVCFSIRCLTSVEVKNGVTIKKIEEIITWDRVIEPGINVANKWDTPSLEDLTDARFTKNQVITYSQEMLKEEVTFESDRVALNDLITRLNRQDRVMQEERLLRW